jgi:hypothetical protein
VTRWSQIRRRPRRVLSEITRASQVTPSPAFPQDSDTDFSDAAFADGAVRLPFKLTRVLSPGAHHVWPAGWGVGPEGKAGHLVVRVKHDGRS